MDKRDSHQKWTEEDREKLRQLASIHSSDVLIARAMGRTVTAVGWQRRVLRIKLTGERLRRHAGGRKKLVVSVEPPEQVERLMELVGLR